ncbi:MAG TPA: hypothetical protein VNW71_14380 [Thermoanaerobaculia bacterium]|nr:hypothetical protein [Thermoanaerobaculia bacterium]
MPLPEETAAELEGMRTRLLEMLAPLQREGPSPESKDEGSPDLEEQALRHSLWSAVHALDVMLRDEHLPVDLDLDHNGEATRQILYDFVAWEYFTPHTLEDSGDITVPRYTPEESGLRVFFEYGRWFVTWLMLEKDSSQPEAQRRELLVFEKDKDGHLFLSEV